MTSSASAGFELVGSVSVTADTHQAVVGPVSLAVGADTLWLRVTQQGGESPWPWGYGLAAFVTTNGKELGTVKVYGNAEGEIYRLGIGLPPLERSGVLIFRPRAFSLGWLRSGNATWNLSFQAQSGTTGTGGAGGRTGSITLRFPVADQDGQRPWSLAWPKALARLDFR